MIMLFNYALQNIVLYPNKIVRVKEILFKKSSNYYILIFKN